MALPLRKLSVRQRIVEVGWYRQVWKLSKPARHGLYGHELGDGSAVVGDRDRFAGALDLGQ